MRYIEKKHKIKNDEYTKYIYESFDIQNQEETSVKIPINFSECKSFDWNIGVIYGGSGTGKTTLLKEFGEITVDNFDYEKPLISNFYWLNPEEATFLLSAMGLASVPTWLRPFRLLSNGEQYRASLAYKIGKAKQNEVVLIDEYTSVVDRDVAKAMSNAVQKYIRKNNKKIILASCHFDIMDWLLPDWIYSPIKGRLERASLLWQRPTIELQVFRCRYEAWDIFKQHHYLTENLNKAAKNFIFLWNEKPIAFIGVLPFPNGSFQDAFRISRLVVLPDFQGLGIGFKILNYISQLYKNIGKTMYIRTSNPGLYLGMQKRKEWVECNNSGVDRRGQTMFTSGPKSFRIAYSFRYENKPNDENTDIVTFNADAYRDVAQNQITLF
jgi:ABC-type lipoprotein export system ATPase subunit/GNAT superfamily N-acetyltransferase